MALRTNVRSDNTGGQQAGGSLTTGSFTPANNSLLVIVAHFQSSISGTFTFTITDNLGVHLTYTNIIQIGPDATNHHVSAFFTAPVGTGAAMTVTVGGGPTDGTFEGVIHVYTYTAYNTGSPTGGTASLNPALFGAAVNLTLSSAPALTSEVLACANSDTSAGAADITVGTGWTATFADSDTANTYTLDEIRTNSTSTNVLWDANAGGNTGVALAVEIKDAIAGGGIAIPRHNFKIDKFKTSSRSMGPNAGLMQVKAFPVQPTQPSTTQQLIIEILQARQRSSYW